MNNTELYVVKGKVYEQKKGFSAEVGEDIGFEKGAKMIKTYYDQNREDILAHFIGRNIVEDILAQPGVVGLRMFHAQNELGLKTLVMVGVDEKGNNVLNFTSVGENGELIKKKGIVADRVRNCPPYCGESGGIGGDSTNWFA